MKDERKTKRQLIDELIELRRQITESRKSGVPDEQAEHVLRQSEGKFKAHYRGVPIPTYIWQRSGEDFVLVDYNDAAVKITEGNVKDFVGVKATELYHDRPEIQEEMLQCFVERASIKREMPYRFKTTGRTCYLAVSYVFVPPDLVLVHTEDITSRRKAEQDLKTSEERFRDIVDNALEWIWEVDSDGKYTYASPAVEKILGYKPEEVLKKHFYELYPPEDREGLKKVALEVFERRHPFRELINPNVHKNGKIVWLSRSGLPIVDEKGEFLGYRGADMDITQHEKAEQALRDSEELYRAIFEQAADSIVLIDVATGTLVEFNDKTHENLGYTREEFQVMKIPDFEVTESPEEVWKHILRIVKQGSDTFETKHRTKSGEIRDILVNSRIISISGRQFIQGIWRDVTEEKRVDRLKDEFVSTVSHEFGTPISIAKEGITLVLDGILGEINEKQKKFLGTARDNMDRLALIASDLLDMSRIEAGMMQLRQKSISIKSLMQRLIFSFEPKVKRKGLKLEVNLPKKEELHIYVDVDRITQVFTNLVDNAIKFTKEGSVEISIRAKEDEVECCVADTGTGISRENLSGLFDKFTQFGRRAGPGQKGTGLGLAISKRIVELHGGRIWVESEFGKGSMFYFSLPGLVFQGNERDLR